MSCSAGSEDNVIPYDDAKNTMTDSGFPEYSVSNHALADDDPEHTMSDFAVVDGDDNSAVDSAVNPTVDLTYDLTYDFPDDFDDSADDFAEFSTHDSTDDFAEFSTYDFGNTCHNLLHVFIPEQQTSASETWNGAIIIVKLDMSVTPICDRTAVGRGKGMDQYEFSATFVSEEINGNKKKWRCENFTAFYKKSTSNRRGYDLVMAPLSDCDIVYDNECERLVNELIPKQHTATSIQWYHLYTIVKLDTSVKPICDLTAVGWGKGKGIDKYEFSATFVGNDGKKWECMNSTLTYNEEKRIIYDLEPLSTCDIVDEEGCDKLLEYDIPKHQTTTSETWSDLHTDVQLDKDSVGNLCKRTFNKRLGTYKYTIWATFVGGEIGGRKKMKWACNEVTLHYKNYATNENGYPLEMGPLSTVCRELLPDWD